MKLLTQFVSVSLCAGFFCILFAGTALAQNPCASLGSRTPTAQNRIVQRDIQEAMEAHSEEWAAKDLKAVSRQFSLDFTVRLLDGTTLNHRQVIEGMQQQLDSVLRIDEDRSYTRIECLEIKGSETIVYTKQQFVRTLLDRHNGSPHEVITSVRHRETWVDTKDGWLVKRVEELEQGQTYLDGEPYDPS